MQTLYKTNLSADGNFRDHFLVKSYQEIEELQQAMLYSKGNTIGKLGFSILQKGKEPLAHDLVLCTQEFQNIHAILEDEFPTTTKSGMFFNPEIGVIFCLGALSPMFLQQIDGKALGAIGTGVYGIIRGLGINEQEARQNINALSQGNYLLFISGRAKTIEVLKQNLNNNGGNSKKHQIKN